MRRWREADRVPFAAMNADPEVMQYFRGSTLDRAASDQFMDRIEAHFDEHGFGLWALELPGTAEFIGFTGLSPMPAGVPGEGCVEIGWRLARAHWGHGYATEAAIAAVQVAFGGADLPELWSMTPVLNRPSQAVMRRLGMTRHSYFNHPRVEPGHRLRPHVVYWMPSPAAAAEDEARDVG